MSQVRATAAGMISVGRFSERYWKEPEGGYGGQCIEMPGARNQGETFEELKTNVEDAVRLTLEYRKASEHDSV